MPEADRAPCAGSGGAASATFGASTTLVWERESAGSLANRGPLFATSVPLAPGGRGALTGGLASASARRVAGARSDGGATPLMTIG